MRSRILLRNLSRENEGLGVECSASNSDRTTGRTDRHALLGGGGDMRLSSVTQVSPR